MAVQLDEHMRPPVCTPARMDGSTLAATSDGGQVDAEQLGVLIERCRDRPV
jgi:hypothetical protein